jgi:tryptophanyl-tRNA synthetase
VALEELTMAEEDDEDDKSSSQWEWNTSQWEFDPQRHAPDVTIDGEGSRVHFGMRTGTCLLLPKTEEPSSSLSLPSSSLSSSGRLRQPSSVVLRLKLASRSYDAIDCDCVGMRRTSNRSLDKSFVDGSLGLDGEGGIALSACGALLVHTSVGLIDSPPMLEPFEQGDEILMHVRRSTRSLSIAKNGVEVARYAGVPEGWRFAVSSGARGVWEIVDRPKWSRVLTPLDTRATPHALLRADYAEAEAMETKGSKSGAQTECAHFARTAPLTWVEMLEKSRVGHAKRMQQLAAYALRQAKHEQALEQARALIEGTQSLSSEERERLLGYIAGTRRQILTEPQALLTEASRLPGLDGQKMSKSYGNAIAMREDPASVTKKIRTMPTDPARVRRTDPGEPDRCPVWQLHQVYSSATQRDWVQAGCRSAGIGCLECKQPVIDAVIAEQQVFFERAQPYLDDPARLKAIVADGCDRARAVAQETMREVREVMGLSYS